MTTTADNLMLHLKKTYPMLQYFTDRTFGVEIEFFGLKYVIAPIDGNIIKPYCISSRAKDGRNFWNLFKECKIPLAADSNSWHFEQDGSVRGKGHTRCGAELISPILSGIEGLLQVYHALKFLGNIEGIDVDKSCGLHVHHGITPEVFGCQELQKLVRIVHCYEQDFYLLIPGDRQNSATCRPMEIDVEAFLSVCDGDYDDINCRIKELWYSAKNRYDKNGGENARYDKTRYHGLNLHSYWYRSTIEFRYHSALLHQIDEAMQWIIFTQFLIEMSQGHHPDIYYYPEANKWLETLCSIYEDFGYADRIKRIEN
jgi:hypothetical protein